MNLQLFDLTGKVAIVTGGNGGLGLGMAMGLASAGADIVVAARNQEKTQQAVHQIEGLGVKALGVYLDVLQPEMVAACMATTVDTFGGFDILVANSGTVVRKPPEELSIDDDALDTVVDLIDQIHGLRHQLACLATAIAGQSEDVQRAIAAAVKAARGGH